MPPLRSSVSCPLLQSLPSSLSASTQTTILVRHATTARRMTKLLRTKPTKSAPSKRGQLPPHDTITFTPPSSSPTPFHTPAIFLPASDPRRQLLSPSHPAHSLYAHYNPYALSSPTSRPLPPLLNPRKPPREKTYNLSPEQVAELRALRAQDPFTWTRGKLAEKFGCTEYFVGMCSRASDERMDWAKRQLEATKARWGDRRRGAREERTKRRAMWGRDE